VRAATFAGYIVIVVAMIVYELFARARQRATFADAVTAITSTRVGKGLLVLGWLWLGWHLFVRTGPL
jgi:hypothetical protein